MVQHLTIPKQEENGLTCYHHHGVSKSNSNKDMTSTLIDEIRCIYYQLSQLKTLLPSDHVNALFTKLVTICTFQYNTEIVKAVLEDVCIIPLIPNLRAIASQGEYYLELTWAKELVYQTKNHKDTKPELDRFVYYQNYVDLVRLELHALQSVGANLNHSIVFIGSGPLPLSSILMYEMLSTATTLKEHTLTIHNLDRDQESISVSNILLEKLGIHHGVHQHTIDAAEYLDYTSSDVVILGALVGQDVKEKMEFLTNISSKMKQGSFIMIRSSHSLRKLLYPSIEPYQVNKCGFETTIVLHPFNDVVNSILIAKKI
ncbi:Nicotianamine synthase [Cokeromyces recurvatus]|uniref:Nicotianamine synthase n=1 Tax=Cokeromyces recurvatus TaxID=90255 RepID=UPI00221ECAF7|nr:Nicotianamine synthase [Cokeromyces recurvatus]KAI7905514.1 Nicotianamine synthase [Cokeromyces recurvatus]